MMQANLQQLAYQYADVLNTGQLDQFDVFIAADYVNHNPYAKPGVQGVKEVFAWLLSAFPDMQVTVEAVYVTDNAVIGRYSYCATHQGEFLGTPATGKPIALRSIDIWHVENGMFVEHWDELNISEVLQQIGAIPS